MADNCLLRAEYNELRRENIPLKEALKNAMSQTCGGPLEEQRLPFENAQLEEELERASSIAEKYEGRQLLQFAPPQVQPSHLSSYVGGAQQRMITTTSRGPLVHLGASPTTIHHSHPAMDKSLVIDIAKSAMDELISLFQTNEPLWTKSAVDGRDVLDLHCYERIFPRPNTSMRNPNIRIEASKATGDVMMNNMQLADMFTDSTKWGNLFPTIVSKATTTEVMSIGSFGNPSGSLQLMYEELQVVSPLVPIRQFNFIRFCKQIDQDTWAVVDVSYDLPQDDGFPYSQFNSRRLPSGCLIQSMPNGSSKVTWVEHLEIEDKTTVHRLYRDLVYSSLAFGAERWVACLQRSCERIVCQMVTNSSTHELGGVIPEGKKSVMKLAQRMVNNFCASISPCNGLLWSSVWDFDDLEVHATLYKSTGPGRPNREVLGAAATIWLPLSPQFVFDFLRDERNRPQWDVLGKYIPVQEVAHIANGAYPGNCISVLMAPNTSQTNILILQESCTDTSGSLVVYCHVDLPAIEIAMSGEDRVNIPLLPSGFAITTDGRHSTTGGNTGGASTGSLVTLVLQMLVTSSSLPWAIIGPRSMPILNNLIGGTVRQIKAALNRTSATT